jgi:tetratricopeptide (TPR) repeat protein
MQESVLQYLQKCLITCAAVIAVFVTPISATGQTLVELAEGRPVAGLNLEETKLQIMKLNALLVQDPGNPQILLQKGIRLSDMGRLQAAFEIFDTLRQAFPEQPAPYTNLAAIYARWGRLEDARQMLIKSNTLQADRFQTQVSLASVNIGLAIEALAKAREINPNDALTQTKLGALEKYVADVNKLTSGGFTPSAMPSAQKPSTKGLSDQLKLEVGTYGSNANAANAPNSQAPSSNKRGSANADIVASVMSWAEAWMQKSPDNYFSHYSAAFEPFDGVSRSVWEQKKRTTIENATFIQVDLKILSIQQDAQAATVEILQTYRSDSFSDRGRKELKLGL